MHTDIELLQDLYAAALSSKGPWLHTAFEILRPHFDTGLGALGFEIDLRAPQVCITRAEDMPGDPALARITSALYDRAKSSMRKIVRSGGPVNLLREVLGVSIRDHPLTGSLARPLGAYDSFGLRPVDVDGRGMILITLVPEGFSLPARTRRRWNQLAGHLVAAGRLHHVASRAGLDEIARISGRGRFDGTPDVPCAPLVEAARRLEQAHRESDPEQALSMWRVLISARWTLIPQAGAYARTRTFLAYENAPTLPNPLALTKLQRVIAEMVSLGHSNKLIAYDLGLPEGTVNSHISSIRRKLKASSRAGLVQIVAALDSAPAKTIDFDGVRFAVGTEVVAPSCVDSQLTASEKEVAHLASQGLSDRDIADIRAARPRTIANQLASIYRKLKISSRAQLARLLRSRGLSAEAASHSSRLAQPATRR